MGCYSNKPFSSPWRTFHLQVCLPLPSKLDRGIESLMTLANDQSRSMLGTQVTWANPRLASSQIYAVAARTRSDRPPSPWQGGLEVVTRMGLGLWWYQSGVGHGEGAVTVGIWTSPVLPLLKYSRVFIVCELFSLPHQLTYIVISKCDCALQRNVYLVVHTPLFQDVGRRDLKIPYILGRRDQYINNIEDDGH